MAVTRDRLSLEQFLHLPEEEPALEFEDGLVTRKVSPRGRHSRLQYKLAERINLAAEPPRLAMAFPELRTTFGGSSPVPDVSVYSWDRVPRTASGKLADDFREPPDLVIEIVSPRQGVNALIRRCLRFVERGVSIAALVDPEDESVSVFRQGAEPLSLRGADQLDLSVVVPGLRLNLQELFESLYDR
jgi:Uma2 family endonuclease